MSARASNRWSGDGSAAGNALKESEERYRNLYEAAPLGIAVTDYSGKILEVNSALCQLMGVTTDEAKSSRASDYYATPGARKHLLRLVEGSRPAQFETLLRRKDGSVFPALLQVNPTDLHGRQALLTAVQDLTSQKQSQQRLQRLTSLLELFVARPNRDDYLKSVVNLLRKWCGCHGVGIRLVNQEGRLAYAASCGLGREFLVPAGQTCWNINGCACMKNLCSLPFPPANNRSGGPISFVCHQPCDLAKTNRPELRKSRGSSNSSVSHGSVAIIPIRSKQGVVGSIHLSDRRSNHFGPEAALFLEAAASVVNEALHRFEAEEALRESELRFRSLFEKHSAIMLLIDPRTGALVDANSTAASFYRYSRQRLRSAKLQDLGISLPGENEWNGFETTTRLSNGVERAVEVLCSPISVRRGKLVFAILRDVTEQRNLEQQVVQVGEQERQRIGRDLHDSLGGQLTGIALLAKVVVKKLDKKGAEAELAAELVDGLRKAIAITRDTARLLCPVDAGKDGLLVGLHKLAAEVSLRTGADCHCRVECKTVYLEEGVGLHLFRIAEEAVQNAFRHARAKQIKIRLRRASSGLELQIWNDGKLLPARLNAVKGLGLRSMRYRAAIIGARFEIQRGRRGGTVVRCWLPERKLKKNEPI